MWPKYEAYAHALFLKLLGRGCGYLKLSLSLCLSLSLSRSVSLSLSLPLPLPLSLSLSLSKHCFNNELSMQRTKRSDESGKERKYSVMTFYNGINAISNAGDIYKNISSYITYLHNLTQTTIISRSYQVCKSRCTFDSLIIYSNYDSLLCFKKCALTLYRVKAIILFFKIKQ